MSFIDITKQLKSFCYFYNRKELLIHFYIKYLELIRNVVNIRKAADKTFTTTHEL